MEALVRLMGITKGCISEKYRELQTQRHFEYPEEELWMKH